MGDRIGGMNKRCLWRNAAGSICLRAIQNFEKFRKEEKMSQYRGKIYFRNLIKLLIDKTAKTGYCYSVIEPNYIKGGPMESITLNEIIQFTLGKNPTRIRAQADILYTSEDFDKDLHCIHSTKEGRGCIINLIKSKCSPISEQTEAKCITSNFLRCDFDTGKICPWYFCYQFNEGKGFEQQIEMYHQGTTLSVKKLNIKTIGELKIILPDIEKQRTIGNLYRQSIIQNDLMIKQAEDVRKFAMTLIRRMEED